MLGNGESKEMDKERERERGRERERYREREIEREIERVCNGNGLRGITGKWEIER